MHPYRVFTLSEANGAVPRVAELTASVRLQLDTLRRAHNETGEGPVSRLEEAIRDALTDWEHDVWQLGAEPKGIFTVDFRSPDPNVLWCWTVDEPHITHRHYTWESFKDRVPLDVGKPGWPSSN